MRPNLYHLISVFTLLDFTPTVSAYTETFSMSQPSVFYWDALVLYLHEDQTLRPSVQIPIQRWKHHTFYM